MKPNLQRPAPADPVTVDIRVLKAAQCLLEERLEQVLDPSNPSDETLRLFRALDNVSEAIDEALRLQTRPWTRADL
jgi:hypothetical protein